MCWRADVPIPEFQEMRGCDSGAFFGEVEVRRVDALSDRTPLRTVNTGFVCPDGIRLPWNGEIVFDMFDGERIEYLPLRRWRGVLPSSFYSTMAALTTAWRGALPLHACAVEIKGSAFLIAGRSGAGKSSLAAGLIALGAKLVADDLTVLRLPADAEPMVFPGRVNMRQHRESAAVVASELSTPILGDDRGKWLVRPKARTSRTTLPLGGILLLEKADAHADAADRLALLLSNLFRPRWLAALPNHATIRRHLLAVASRVPLQVFPRIAAFDRSSAVRRAEEAMDALEGMRAV